MKNLNSILLVNVFLLFVKTAAAQQSINIGPEIGIPTGFGHVYSIGVGVSSKITYSVNSSKNLFISGSLGYYTMIANGNTDELELGKYSVIPVMFGFDYSVNAPFYLTIESGVAIGVGGQKENRFALTPGAGLNINKNLNLDLRYHLWNGNGLLALGLAYRFGY